MLFFNNTLRSFKVKKFLIDRLLFPKDFFKKITDKLHTLYIGIVLIGLVDLGMSLIYKIPFYFYNKPTEILVYNISLALALLFSRAFGYIIFAMPLFDIFKNFALRSE